MRKALAIFVGAALVAGAAYGQALVWAGNSAMNVDVDGSTTWYNGGANWAGSSFDGANLGTVNASLAIGGEVQTYSDDSDTSGSGITANMGYQLDGDTAQEGSLALPYNSANVNNAVFTDATGTAIVPSGNGVHTVGVWFYATKGTVTQWDSNNGNNYTATFDYQIPEPTTLVLMGIGIGGAVVAIRRRKK